MGERFNTAEGLGQGYWVALVRAFEPCLTQYPPCFLGPPSPTGPRPGNRLEGPGEKAKKNYEQKCRDKDEAEQAVHRSANVANPKQQEKLFVKLATSKTAVEDSDKVYMLHVNTLDKVRNEWQSEHIKACEVFETQECERINFFRNALWLHMNQLSQQCVTSDEMYEKVRKSLEMCSIEKDIEYFVNHRRTGQTPPAPIMYENFYCPQKNAAPPGKATGPNSARRGPLPNPKSLPDDPDYSLLDNNYSLIYQ